MALLSNEGGETYPTFSLNTDVSASHDLDYKQYRLIYLPQVHAHAHPHERVCCAILTTREMSLCGITFDVKAQRIFRTDLGI